MPVVILPVDKARWSNARRIKIPVDDKSPSFFSHWILIPLLNCPFFFALHVRAYMQGGGVKQ